MNKVFQSLYEQSIHDLAYTCMWLENMLRLKIGQILTLSKT